MSSIAEPLLSAQDAQALQLSRSHTLSPCEEGEGDSGYQESVTEVFDDPATLEFLVYGGGVHAGLEFDASSSSSSERSSIASDSMASLSSFSEAAQQNSGAKNTSESVSEAGETVERRNQAVVLEGNDSVPVARSASSTGSGATFPDVGAAEEAGREGRSSLATTSSPTGSEEDVSGKESDDPFEENGHISPSEDELGEQWNPDLYTLQSKAPKPRLVPCTREIERPTFYGNEYHGALSRENAHEILGSEDGSFLVRDGHFESDTILSFILCDKMWNFRLYYSEGHHYVGEKKFEYISDLVQDGLITLYLVQNNVLQALERGRKLTRVHTQRLRRQPCRRVKGPKGKSKSVYLERLRLGSFDSPPAPRLRTLRQASSPEGLMRMTPNSNDQQSDLDLTLVSERRGTTSTSSIQIPTTSTPAQKSLDRRCNSIDSLQHAKLLSKRITSPVATLRDVVRAEKESFTQSVDISILSEKAAAVLGIGPPKQFKRASMYDPLVAKRIEKTERVSPPLPRRPHSYLHFNAMGSKKSRSEKVTSLPRDIHKLAKKPPSSSSSLYYKAHKFKTVTYTHPTWCVICHHFLWGLKMQGLRCQDCGIDIHRQCCSESLDHECSPTKKMVKRVFGVDLTTLAKVEETKIPSVLETCIKYIETTGMEEEGLYRVSGLSSELLDLKDKFDHQDSPSLVQYSDINVITGGVKLFLRELPIPLITFDAYPEAMKATSSITDPSDPDVDWSPLANALKLLPKAHYNVLQFLVQHLHKVDHNSMHNRMTARNLAVVFAPTLMRAPAEDLSLIKDIHIQKHFVELLILKHDSLFN